MADSPPTNRRTTGTMMSSCSSPKTPVHPSRGYAVMDNDDNFVRRPPASSRKSPRRSPRKRSSLSANHVLQTMQMQTKETNHNTSPLRDAFPQDMKPSYEAPRTEPRPPPQDCGGDVVRSDIPVAVTQDDEPDADDFVVVSQEDAAPASDDASTSTSESGNETGTSKPKARRRRKSTGDASKTTRRRSARLEAKHTLAPLTPEPEKKAPPANENDTDCKSNESSHDDDASDDLISLDMMEDDSEVEEVSKPSSRRRSCRIRAKMVDTSTPTPLGEREPEAVDAANKKGQSKRRQSSAGKGSGKKAKMQRSIMEEKEAADRRTEEDTPLPLPKRLNLEQKEAPVTSTVTFEIGMTDKGHVKLAEALERMALDVVFAPNVSNRKSAGRRRKKRGSRGKTSPTFLALEAMELESTAKSSAVGPGKENVVNSSVKEVRPRGGRRDTFDLSKKRGVTSSAKRVELDVFIDNQTADEGPTPDYVKPKAGINEVTSSTKRVELNVFIDNQAAVEGPIPDYVTPKAGSNEVNINSIVGELSRTLDDDPRGGHNHGEVKASESPELSAVKSNLQNLTSIAIEEKMRELFPDKIKRVYKYPCVSARIFAAMSVVYGDQAEFTPLLSFLLSLVDAEIVSLKSKQDTDIRFMKKKVFFCAFDYSATTTAIGAVVGQGGGDMRPSIEALEAVLLQALKLPRPVHYLDVAIQCLQCMAGSGEANDACANTVFGYFPSTRFGKAFKYYLDEFKDVKNYVLSHNTQVSEDHFGVRYRLNDFIGRSVRFHLRELINTIPENVVDFNVEECEERWGRAVDDRSISSILNFSLERIHELMLLQPKIFEYGVQNMPEFFSQKASTDVHSLSRDGLKDMDTSMYENLMIDITEARSFLFGARACKFVLELLSNEHVEEHIDSAGGWGSMEAIASTFYKLNLYEGSENEHFVQLREVRDLIFMLEDVDQKFEETVDHCEFCIRRLRRKFSFKASNSVLHNLKTHLAAEKGEHFPGVVTR